VVNDVKHGLRITLRPAAELRDEHGGVNGGAFHVE
jgi:hypothetical protein